MLILTASLGTPARPASRVGRFGLASRPARGCNAAVSGVTGVVEEAQAVVGKTMVQRAGQLGQIAIHGHEEHGQSPGCFAASTRSGAATDEPELRARRRFQGQNAALIAVLQRSLPCRLNSLGERLSALLAQRSGALRQLIRYTQLVLHHRLLCNRANRTAWVGFTRVRKSTLKPSATFCLFLQRPSDRLEHQRNPMSIADINKADIVKAHARAAADTGSP